MTSPENYAHAKKDMNSAQIHTAPDPPNFSFSANNFDN